MKVKLIILLTFILSIGESCETKLCQRWKYSQDDRLISKGRANINEYLKEVHADSFEIYLAGCTRQSYEFECYFYDIRSKKDSNLKFCYEFDNQRSLIVHHQDFMKSLSQALKERKDTLSVSPNTEKKCDRGIETLELEFNAISCNCAKWSESKYKDDPDKRKYLWLEPSSGDLIDANTLFKGENLPIVIQVSGRYVSESGFPQGYPTGKTSLTEAGKVFRYSEIKVLKK